MCRVLLAHKHDLLEYETTYSVEYLLTHLEKEQGGHGNGLVLIKDKNIVFYEKGINFTVQKSYETLLKENYDVAIWHTRIASIGETNDNNCHPYVYGNHCLAMNGTEYDFATLADYYDTTDTDALARALFVAGTPKNATHVAKFLAENLESVFVGAVNGVPFVAKGAGQLAQWERHCFWASSFPTQLFKDLKVNQLYRGYSVNLGPWHLISYKIKYPYTYNFYNEKPYLYSTKKSKKSTKVKAKNKKSNTKSTEKVTIPVKITTDDIWD